MFIIAYAATTAADDFLQRVAAAFVQSGTGVFVAHVAAVQRGTQEATGAHLIPACEVGRGATDRAPCFR